MINKTVLITGLDGMLGKVGYNEFKSKYSTVLATLIDENEEGFEFMDVWDIQTCEKIFENFKPEIVFHLSALTDFEYCDANADNYIETNIIEAESIVCFN